MTAAGPTDTAPPAAKAGNPRVSGEQIDTINQVFALFRINYHNQYHAAFGDTAVLNQAKKLWAESLSRFSPEAILAGAKRVIEASDYLPTLHRMISACQGTPAQHGMPETHSAYLEACRAPSPKSEHAWSHPAVYHAGRECDWFFLSNTSEREAFPIFKRHYENLCARVLDGETLQLPDTPKLTESSALPLSKSENLARLKALRDEMGL